MPERDLGDALPLFDLEENPDRWESIIVDEQRRARDDEAARATLASIYCDEDRDAAFERFLQSYELGELLLLLDALGVRRDARICEVGGGPGWLSWALTRHGYQRVELLEPNGHFVTGTGYLRSRPDGAAVVVHNSLADWYHDTSTYDVVITHNCIHHFRNITYVAACIRQKVSRGGRWLALREPFVDDARQLYTLLHTHPFVKHGVFEFAAPPSHYVDSIELAGFSLRAVAPRGYANGAFSSHVDDGGRARTRALTSVSRQLVARAPSLTSALYRAERAVRQLTGRGPLRFSRPEAMVFERVEVR